MKSLWPTNQTTLIRHLIDHPQLECHHWVSDCNGLMTFKEADGLCLILERNDNKQRNRVPLTVLAGMITYDAEGFTVTKDSRRIKYVYCGDLPWKNEVHQEKKEEEPATINPAHYFECEQSINEALGLV